MSTLVYAYHYLIFDSETKQLHELLLYVENVQNHYLNTKNNSKMHNTPSYAESLIKSEGSKVCREVKDNIIRG